MDRAAASALETVLAGATPPRWAGLAFDLLRERHGEKREKRRGLEVDPLIRASIDASSGPGGPTLPEPHFLVQEWERFKQRHHLAPKLLPLPVEPPVPGTGGETTL